MAEQYEKFPTFNFFPRDWILGTAELTPEQQGAFIRLLAYAWEQTPPCTLPLEGGTLAMWVGVSPQKWRTISGPVLAKFEVVDGRYVNGKLLAVYVDMCAHRARRRSAAERGNEIRWGSQSDRNAIAKQSLPTPTPKRKNTSNTSPTATDLLFEAIWLEYPRKIGKQAALKAWNKLILRGDPKVVEAGILRYAAYVKANATDQQYIKHLATLLNSGDWQDDWSIEGVVPLKAKQPDPDEWWVNERIV